MKSALITIIICIVVFEIVEHLIPPMFWMIRKRKRKSSVGPSGMIGKKCIVKIWDGKRGKVQLGSELWHATAQSLLIPGEEVVVEDMEGLTLRVSASKRLFDSSEISIKNDHEHESAK